jgi:hypothetical protein
MNPDFGKGGFVLSVSAVNLATGLELAQCEVAFSIVLLGKIAECFDNLFVHALAE